MKYHEMTKNYIFREFECGLSKEETAKLCFKNVRTITAWDSGKAIPKECKRLMRMHKKIELSHYKQWEGFSMEGDRMRTPTGQLVSPQQILTGLALVEIGSQLEIRTSTHLLKIARAISDIRN